MAVWLRTVSSSRVIKSIDTLPHWASGICKGCNTPSFFCVGVSTVLNKLGDSRVQTWLPVVTGDKVQYSVSAQVSCVGVAVGKLQAVLLQCTGIRYIRHNHK